MKINEPVTQVEQFMQEGSTLVSKTDLKGIITWVLSQFNVLCSKNNHTENIYSKIVPT
ncbi:MAG: hypothetical protein HN826_03415 [Methylococcales bacterium]|jgi:hypothetical protein|nr:hypothetical protein [Methylococcales bacterium]